MLIIQPSVLFRVAPVFRDDHLRSANLSGISFLEKTDALPLSCWELLGVKPCENFHIHMPYQLV